MTQLCASEHPLQGVPVPHISNQCLCLTLPSLDIVTQATQPMLPSLQPYQLSQLLLGVANLNILPPRPWLAAALQASQAKVASFSPQVIDQTKHPLL